LKAGQEPQLEQEELYVIRTDTLTLAGNLMLVSEAKLVRGRTSIALWLLSIPTYVSNATSILGGPTQPDEYRRETVERL
jgi:hypothetical protein